MLAHHYTPAKAKAPLHEGESALVKKHSAGTQDEGKLFTHRLLELLKEKGIKETLHHAHAMH